MASKKPSELVACTAPSANDWLILGLANAASNTERVAVEVLLTNASSNVTSNVITGSQLIATDNATPANSTANTTQGRIWYDDDYLYIAIGDNLIKRVTLDTF